MQGKPNDILPAVAGFGALAGMRSLAAPAFLSHRLAHAELDRHGVRRTPSGGLGERILSSPLTSRLLGILAAGEMAADKSRWIPRRVAPLPLAGRTLIGGLIGGLLASRASRPKLAPIVLGGVAAVGSTFAVYYLRQGAKRRLAVPDAVVGAVEDGLVMALGSRLESAVH